MAFDRMASQAYLTERLPSVEEVPIRVSWPFGSRMGEDVGWDNRF